MSAHRVSNNSRDVVILDEWVIDANNLHEHTVKIAGPVGTISQAITISLVTLSYSHALKAV
jgi:hypothetical protein